MKHLLPVVLLAVLAAPLLMCQSSEPAIPKTEPQDVVRIREIPLSVQCWTFRKFTFLEALEKIEALGITCVEAYPGQKLGGPDDKATFHHDMNMKSAALVKEKLKEHGLRLVAYGVVGFKNDEKEMRKVFDFARKMGIGVVVTEPAYDDYSLIDKMAQEYRIKVAIHNHPDPNKYAYPETVLEHVKNCSKWIGDCGDTGHWMRTGVKPVDALKLLEGRIVHMHLKDLDSFGNKNALDVPFGSGKADVKGILEELTRQGYRGYLSVEHENPNEVENPSPPIAKGKEYIESITYYKGYDEILSYGWNGFSKHGWNHYGPGYFELDSETGVLKGNGGMGLFWYSAKKYGDFILELDYKCSKPVTNSGIFLRIPDFVTSDDYIYHSFEVQIDDASKGIHTTAAVYDAEAPKLNATKPTGEWNHYKISFVGDVISVELNGVLVNEWKAEPRGKIRDFASEGYIGLQNHDSISPVYFRNVFVKEL
ncbi:DUF1080 domain-containing protein [bacterium]|nr:DUF1080 domain-containing protein [bacterium]